MYKKAHFTGNISFISLADIFQILGGNCSQGLLRLSSPYSPSPGLIYFRDGNPVSASCGSMQDLEALYAMFGWLNGEFAFYEEPVSTKKSIGKSRMQIVLDALRMLDDGLIQKIGPASLVSATNAPDQEGPDKNKMRIIKGSFLDYSYVIKEELYDRGERIVKEKCHGKWMWIVYEGIVRVEKDTPYGPVTIARLGEGAFIGTFKALLFGEYARSASVTAETDVRLCLLDAEQLHREYVSLSPIFRTMLLSLDGRLRKTTDKAISLYAGENEIIRLPAHIKSIIDQNSSRQDLYKIEQGEAYLIKENKSENIPLFTLQKNDVFGSIPFLDIGHEPGSVSVMGTSDLRLQPLDANYLQKEYDDLTPTFQNLVNHLGTCIHITTDLLLGDLGKC